MDHLDKLESQSIYIICEAYKQFKDIAILWSIGKDSTTLMWLVRKAFYGRVPFPALHIDTGYKFQGHCSKIQLFWYLSHTQIFWICADAN